MTTTSRPSAAHLLLIGLMGMLIGFVGALWAENDLNVANVFYLVFLALVVGVFALVGLQLLGAGIWPARSATARTSQHSRAVAVITLSAAALIYLTAWALLFD